MRHKRKRKEYGKSPLETITPELFAMVHTSGEIIIPKHMYEELQKHKWEKDIVIKSDSKESDKEILKGAMEQMKRRQTAKNLLIFTFVIFVIAMWTACFLLIKLR